MCSCPVPLKSSCAPDPEIASADGQELQVKSSAVSLVAALWTLAVFALSYLLSAALASWLLANAFPGFIHVISLHCAATRPHASLANGGDNHVAASAEFREHIRCPELREGEVHLEFVTRTPWPGRHASEEPLVQIPFDIRTAEISSRWEFDFRIASPNTLILALTIFPLGTSIFLVVLAGARLSSTAGRGGHVCARIINHLVAIGLGLVLGLSANAALYLQLLDAADFDGFLQSYFIELISTIPLIFLIYGIAIGPLLEEFVFRGRLLRAFDEAGWPILGVFVVSNFFALLHGGVIGWTSSAWILYFIGSSVLSLLYLRQRSWIACYVAHAVYNTTVLTWAASAA